MAQRMLGASVNLRVVCNVRSDRVHVQFPSPARATAYIFVPFRLCNLETMVTSHACKLLSKEPVELGLAQFTKTKDTR